MPSQKRILVVTQHFWPENFRINDIVEGFLQDGIAVDVLCGLPNYPKGEWFPGYSAAGPFEEEWHGARLYRCKEVPRRGNTSVNIFLNYVSWPWYAAHALHRLPGGYDAVFCFNTSPVLMCWPAIRYAKKHHIPFTNYVLDIWPENLYSVLNVKNKALRAIAQGVSDALYKKADRLIAMSEPLQQRLCQRTGMPPQKIAVIPQYCEDFYAVPQPDAALQAQFGGRFNRNTVMKRRRFISFVFVLILCFGMSGCGKEKKTTAPNKFQSDYMEVWGGTTVEEGDFRVINGLLYYIDFETMEGIPICNKPNCRHISWKEDRNTKCDAANIDISTVFPYEGKLYGFRSLSDGGSELVVSDLDGGDWKSKGMFITAEEIFQGGVVVGNQMFFLKDVVVRPEDHITEMRTDTVMCVLNFDTMELKELRREKGVFSIQFLGGTKDYQIYSVQEDNGIKCYQFDYDEEESKEISLKNRTQSVVKADETGFYYNSGIDYPKEVYKHDLETSENEICISEEEAKAAFGKEYLQLIIWDVREDGILFHLVDEKEGDVFWKESKSGEIKRLYLEENLPKKNSRLNSFMFGTEDGIGFSYLQSLDSDNIEWYGYISWEDLLAGKNNIKTLVETKFTGGGKPLDEEGNVIGE